MAAGGGSGGHVTPVVALINELNRLTGGDLSVEFICDRGYYPQAVKMMSSASLPVRTRRIFAGKIRRYHKISLVKRLTDVGSLLLNVRDIFLTALGIAQSLLIVFRFKPDVIFTKGGFVCLPVGLAGRLCKVPLVIHDSDSHAGLTNRVLARWARTILTGAPLENYQYPKKRSFYVGIPVGKAYFKSFSDKQRRQIKAELALPDIDRPMVLAVGGGLGARRLNRVVAAAAGSMLPTVSIVHVTGSGDYSRMVSLAVDHAGYRLIGFASPGDMVKLVAAADVVVTRAGATALAEMSAQAKPTVIVPNPMLSGGHQLKNAEVFARAGAAVVLDETDLLKRPELLGEAVVYLLEHPDRAAAMGRKMRRFARREAATEAAQHIIKTAREEKY